jgi:hypothetical protein
MRKVELSNSAARLPADWNVATGNFLRRCEAALTSRVCSLNQLTPLQHCATLPQVMPSALNMLFFGCAQMCTIG